MMDKGGKYPSEEGTDFWKKSASFGLKSGEEGLAEPQHGETDFLLRPMT